VTDPIAEALDVFVPAFGPTEGDWPGILEAASLPTPLAPADGRPPTAHRRIGRRVTSGRRSVRIAIVLAVLAVATTGAAWAAGVFGPAPLTVFGESFPADAGAGNIFQKVIPDTVKQVATLDIPKVGPVALWHADTQEGGYCLGLRLTNGAWLGIPPLSPLDDGGSLPGCFPTGVIDGGNHHLEWLEHDIDARSVGGAQWRIRTGVITVPGAVKVTDLATGQSTNVIDGNVFILAIQAANPSVQPYQSPHIHLVAYDASGNIIASDCLWGSCTAGGYKP
jgi:hypothetical protein